MDNNNNIASEIHQEKLIVQNEFLYGWIDDNNLLLTEEDIRTMFLEGYEDIKGLNIQETSTTPFASSWMDAKLSKTRARSRLWPTSKSTTTVLNFTTNDLNTSNDVDLKLDEYHETDLECDMAENSKSQETSHNQLTDFQSRDEFSKRKKIDSRLQKSPTISPNNEKKFSINSKITDEVNVKLYNEKSYLNTDYDKIMSLIGQLKHDTTGISHYLYFCALNRVSPLRYVIQNLGKEKLSLQHRGIGNLEIKLITEALRHNTTITWLDLSYNVLEVNSLSFLSKVLKENTFIQTLLLSECKLRKDGLMELYNDLIKNVTIKNLDLSGCDLGDSSCSMLAEILTMNRVLTYLNLARNQIGSDGAELLGDAISSNDTLFKIDLSWNSIANKGALDIAKGLKENIRISVCYLSWNGFSDKSGLEVAQIIKENTTLEELYLQHNRISDKEIETIGQAIYMATDSGETKLRVLDVSSNPISTKGLYNFFKQITKCQSLKLKQIMMEEIPVDFECMQLIESLKKTFTELCITHGPQLIVGNTQDDVQSEGGTFVDLLFLLKSQVNYNGKIFTDVLQNMDINKKGAVSVLQFIEALKIMGVNYKYEQVNDLQQRLDKYGDGTIYFKDYLKKNVDSLTPEANSSNSSPFRLNGSYS
ncbi:nalp (nacht, leucine rich repeat and pyrin domain containing)-related [Schistosoma mansoni]|uniref:Nalp (Nacht, leucine rich repeat and pyrin domain containing)-related n=1 Tax=Schistosoma mansoni TaxID=6183 RepID=G4LXP9_SCHMA|nr:nalp (nacht, leucine rich repeat and pyrin domain containing)-related [Schistosoma mansoni]|eukprot:XP_018646038.1 nalp (nacht, leucine rich repeat and pyrin domain containing)-related [Schistosoma mansoni]